MQTIPTPSDGASAQAWDRIATLARDHALIVQAYGGVMTLATPEEQRNAGLRAQCLRMGNFDQEQPVTP